jgi:chromosome segregation ATPase
MGRNKFIPTPTIQSTFNTNNKNVNNNSIPHQNSFSNNFNFKYSPLANDINSYDSVSILKTQNSVLNKSNLDLKNYNRCLQIELNSYKNKFPSNNLPLTQYDQNLSTYIDTLKTSLNTSQMTNMELNNIFEKVKNENEFLLNENKNFNENLEHFKNLKIEEKNEGNNINTDLINNINEISDENNLIKEELEKILEEIENQNIKNNSLEQMIESYNKTNINGEEMLKKLKENISMLKIKNKEENKIHDEIEQKINDNQINLKEKDEKVSLLNEKVKELNEELLNLKNENISLGNDLNQINNDFNEQKINIKKFENEINKIVTNSNALKECIKDRKISINEFKQSLKAINNLKKNVLEEDENENNMINVKKKHLVEVYTDTNEKKNQLEAIKNNYIQIIQKKDEKIRQLKTKLGIKN